MGSVERRRELRKEGVVALKVEQKRVFDGLATTYPGEPISQSTLADGISSTISAGAEKKGGSAMKTTQLYYEYTLWCLPAATDPRLTRPQTQTHTQTQTEKK